MVKKGTPHRISKLVKMGKPMIIVPNKYMKNKSILEFYADKVCKFIGIFFLLGKSSIGDDFYITPKILVAYKQYKPHIIFLSTGSFSPNLFMVI